jgi:hypothetical protein
VYVAIKSLQLLLSKVQPIVVLNPNSEASDMVRHNPAVDCVHTSVFCAGVLYRG